MKKKNNRELAQCDSVYEIQRRATTGLFSALMMFFLSNIITWKAFIYFCKTGAWLDKKCKMYTAIYCQICY